MPELPEVETVRLQLTKYLVGHKIESVEVRNPRIFQGTKSDIEGGVVTNIRRFAKVLSIDLDTGYSLVIHIKLTGQLIYRGVNLKINNHKLSTKVAGGLGGKHTHVIFNLNNDSKLYYNDFRQFGWIKVIKSDDIESENDFVKNLGPEPFGKLNGKPALLTFDYFQQVISKTRRPIKVLIMDQSKIGGVGNIYANDALWLSKINPKTPSNKLSTEAAKLLYDAIHEVLTNGLKYGGASELSFVTPDGLEGEYQNHTLAYGHNGEDCPRCKKSKFIKYFIGGRGTYVCEYCQK